MLYSAFLQSDLQMFQPKQAQPAAVLTGDEELICDCCLNAIAFGLIPVFTL